MVTVMRDHGSGKSVLRTFFPRSTRPNWRFDDRNLLRLKEYGDFLHNTNRLLDRQVRQKSSQLTQVEAVLCRRVFEYGDTAAGRHLSPASRIWRTLAEMLGLAGGLADTLSCRCLARYRQIIVPPAILNKPGPLSGDDGDCASPHHGWRSDAGSDLDSPLLRMAGRDCRQPP